MMSADEKKTSPKKQPESKPAEAAPKAEKPDATPKADKADAASKMEKADAAPKKQGMGEGQKPVTQAYKDNWNAIFGNKKKR